MQLDLAYTRVVETMNNALRVLLKVKRLARIVVYTLSVYIVTHMIVFFFLFPVGIPLIVFNPNNGYRIKKALQECCSELLANT